MRKKIRDFTLGLLTAVVFFFSNGNLYAQYEDGSLVGTIHDSTGAAVSGTTVAITNNATGLVSKGTTNGEGGYEFPALKVGVYTISASATGFADAVAKNITISVGSRARSRRPSKRRCSGRQSERWG